MEDFRTNDYVRAPDAKLLQRVAQYFLAFAIGIDISGIKEINTFDQC